MSRVLETFGLKKHLDLTIKMEKSEFIKFLELKVRPNRLFFFDLLDSEQKEFYGTINENNFWLRKADRFIPKCPWANATGLITGESNKTVLKLKIKGWNWFILVWLVLLTMMIGLIVNTTIQNGSYGIFVVFGPVFLILYLFAFFKMRQGVKRFKNYLTTELKE
jgi:hypothetical protein